MDDIYKVNIKFSEKPAAVGDEIPARRYRREIGVSPAKLAERNCRDRIGALALFPYVYIISNMGFWKKAISRGLTPSNIICWSFIKCGDSLGSFWGTIRLRLKAPLLGVKLGASVKAHGSVSLVRWPGGEISVGDNVSIISSWKRATSAALAHPTRLRVFGPGAKIEIGYGSQLSGASITARSKLIRIGKGALLGPNCVIVDSDFHRPWPASSRADAPGYENDAPVYIGDYVWIGMNSIILKGVSIGEGAIIGAGSVVSRSIPAYSVACGCPARVTKSVPNPGADRE